MSESATARSAVDADRRDVRPRATSAVAANSRCASITRPCPYDLRATTHGRKSLLGGGTLQDDTDRAGVRRLFRRIHKLARELAAGPQVICL